MLNALWRKYGVFVQSGLSGVRWIDRFSVHPQAKYRSGVLEFACAKVFDFDVLGDKMFRVLVGMTRT